MMVEVGQRPGWDLAGIVIKQAVNGAGPKVGSRVVGLVNAGAWAEQVAVSINRLAELPASVTFAQAATLPTAGLTALWALEKGGPLLHRRVLITGSTGHDIGEVVQRLQQRQFTGKAVLHLKK